MNNQQTQEQKDSEKNNKIIKYPSILGPMRLISTMSRGFLKQEIAFIERTGERKFYLDALKEELKNKPVTKFKKNLTD